MDEAIPYVIGATISIILGAAMALLTAYTRDRANPAKQIAEASAATTESILSTLIPLTERVTTIEAEVRVLHSYIDLLRQQIRSLGAEPLPWPKWPPQIQERDITP